jgi:hypothetical protein
VPPNSTQNLNAKLSLNPSAGSAGGGAAPGLVRPSAQPPAAGTKIVGGPSSYRGGYHLSF